MENQISHYIILFNGFYITELSITETNGKENKKIEVTLNKSISEARHFNKKIADAIKESIEEVTIQPMLKYDKKESV